jgi:hypothetical protein
VCEVKGSDVADLHPALNKMNTQIETDTIAYFYRPISALSNVWKCAGIVGDSNHREFYSKYFAETASPECGLASGVRIASHYLGDRVALVDLENNAG